MEATDYSSILLGRDYGGHDSGYGKTIDCNAALGLIGLLGLIELLRDMIEDMTMEEEEAGARFTRWKRSIGNVISGALPSFLGERSSSFMHRLPAALIPLLHNMVDVNDGFEEPACLERSLCEANRNLKEVSLNQHDFIDRTLNSFLSSLLSQVTVKSFSGHEDDLYTKALKAAEVGRSDIDCTTAYPECPFLKPKYRPISNTNFTDFLLSRAGVM